LTLPMVKIIRFIVLFGLEHFLIWMKISVYPKFRKLWGMVDEDIEAGSYTVLINDCKNKKY